MFASFESKTTITDDQMKNDYLEEMVNDEPPLLEVKMATNPIVIESVEEMESDEPVENRQHGHLLQCLIDFVKKGINGDIKGSLFVWLRTCHFPFMAGHSRAIE